MEAADCGIIWQNIILSLSPAHSASSLLITTWFNELSLSDKMLDGQGDQERGGLEGGGLQCLKFVTFCHLPQLWLVIVEGWKAVNEETMPVVLPHKRCSPCPTVITYSTWMHFNQFFTMFAELLGNWCCECSFHSTLQLFVRSNTNLMRKGKPRRSFYPRHTLIHVRFSNKS